MIPPPTSRNKTSKTSFFQTSQTTFRFAPPPKKMNYVPTYPAPTIATHQARRHRDDEWSSPSSAGSADSFDRRYKTHYGNRHAPMSNMPTTMITSPQILQQQQQLWRNIPTPTLTAEQPTGRRSRSRTRRHHRSYEPHRHHYDSRSRSTDDSPARLPRGYRPTSPDRHSYDRSRSRGFSHSFSLPQNIPIGNGPPGGYSDPRTQPSTMAGTIPLQYTTLPQHVHRHQPSAPSRPIGYSSSRPQYFHRRSRSYDDMVSRPPRNAHPLPQQGYGHHSPMSTHQPHQIQAAAYPGYPPAGMGYGVHPSSISPTAMNPPAHSTTIMPLNDGKDGWVLVPAQGQSVSVMGSNRTRAPSTGSFFGRFLGKSPKKPKYVVPQQPTMMQPVQHVHPHRDIHRSRRRRDSY